MEVIIIVNMSADWHNYHCSLFSLSSILYFFILLLLTLFWKPTACHCLNPIEFLVMFEFRSVCIVFIITAIPIGRDCAISCIILFISGIISVHYLICRPLVLQWTVLPVVYLTGCWILLQLVMILICWADWWIVSLPVIYVIQFLPLLSVF